MAKQRFLALLLVTALLALSFSQGMVEGRKVQVMKTVPHYGRWRSPIRLRGRLTLQQEHAAGMVSTVMDYDGPKPNTNTHGGLIPPPDPTSPPAH